jgi:carboxylesterase type B
LTLTCAISQTKITIGGESAGAVYAHAHLCTSSSVSRGILQSGSLQLSPPQPVERGRALISRLSANIEDKYHVSLREASVDTLLQQLQDENINSLWLQEEDDLNGWQDRGNYIEELLIGDVEYEVCTS